MVVDGGHAVGLGWAWGFCKIGVLVNKKTKGREECGGDGESGWASGGVWRPKGRMVTGVIFERE